MDKTDNEKAEMPQKVCSDSDNPFKSTVITNQEDIGELNSAQKKNAEKTAVNESTSKMKQLAVKAKAFVPAFMKDSKEENNRIQSKDLSNEFHRVKCRFGSASSEQRFTRVIASASL